MPIAKKASTSKANVSSVIASSKRTAAPVQKNFDGVFSPLDNRILIRRMAVSDRTPGGLYIPETSIMERPNQGSVVAVGQGHRDKKGRLKLLDVKIKDIVIFAPLSGQELTLEGEELVLLREDEVLGILKA